MQRINDLIFLREVHHRLYEAQVETWVFGGWAEELRGLRPPGPHRDIDLLYPAKNFQSVDRFLARSGLPEIRAKRFPHKRAFLVDDILVELLLVQPRVEGLYTTFFAGDFVLEWPEDTFLERYSPDGGALPVASQAALQLYRRQHERVEQAYRSYQK